MNKFNHEHYPDPTVRAALDHIEVIQGYRPLIYICSPYAGDVETNVRRARMYCRYALSKKKLPLASHLLFPQFLDDSNKDERELGLFMSMMLLMKCTEVWVFGDKVSSGMKLEIAKALSKGKIVRYFSLVAGEVVEV